jgi:hypothetical protein
MTEYASFIAHIIYLSFMKDKHEYFHLHGSPVNSLSASPPNSNPSIHNPNTPNPNTSNSTTANTNKYKQDGPRNKQDATPTTTLTTITEPYNNSNLENDYTSFPSLLSTNTSLASLSMSAWGRGRGQTLQQQDFPSLSNNAPTNLATTSTDAQWQEEYEDESTPSIKRGGKKSKRKNQVLFHFG